MVFLVALIGIVGLGSIVGYLSRAVAPALRRYFWTGFALHILAAWGVGLIYKIYYGGGDTWYFFAEADRLVALAYTDFPTYLDLLFDPKRTTFESGQERTYYALHWFSLWHLLGGRSYWLTAVYLSALSFSGLWACAEALRFRFPQQERLIFGAFLFTPSVLFWSSGWLKESILWFFLGWGIALFLNLAAGRSSRWWQWLIAGLGLFLIWKIKYYYLAALLPALLTYGLSSFVRRYCSLPESKTVLLQLGLYFGLLLLATRLHWNLHPEHLLEAIFNSHHLVRAETPPHNLLLQLPETPSLPALLARVPEAVAGSLFRPFIWETSSPLKILTGLETFGIALLWVGGIVGRIRQRNIRLRTDRQGLLAVLLYVLVLAVLLPLAAPNLGSLVRFRVSFWPFWVWLSLAFFASSKENAALPRDSST